MKITNKLVLKILFEPWSKICQSLGYRNVSYIISKEIFLNTSTIDFELNTFILETFSCDLDNFRSFTLWMHKLNINYDYGQVGLVIEVQGFDIIIWLRFGLIFEDNFGEIHVYQRFDLVNTVRWRHILRQFWDTKLGKCQSISDANATIFQFFIE